MDYNIITLGMPKPPQKVGIRITSMTEPPEPSSLTPLVVHANRHFSCLVIAWTSFSTFRSSVWFDDGKFLFLSFRLTSLFMWIYLFGKCYLYCISLFFCPLHASSNPYNCTLSLFACYAYHMCSILLMKMPGREFLL